MKQEYINITALRDHIVKHGRKGLLPQNLPANLLKEMSVEADAISKGQSEISPMFMLFVTILYIEKGSEIFNGTEININQKRFMENLDLYILAIRLEEMRRNKIIIIPDSSLPTLKNIFDPSHNMDIVVPKTSQ